jgi:hypothetical protein
VDYVDDPDQLTGGKVTATEWVTRDVDGKWKSQGRLDIKDIAE